MGQVCHEGVERKLFTYTKSGHFIEFLYLGIINNFFFLKAVISRNQIKFLVSDGNDHLYRDHDFSWNAYIHA